MNKQDLIERTVKAIQLLPDDKAAEISDFADFVFKRYEESQLNSGIQNMTESAESFHFLKEDDEIYSLADLKEVYNGLKVTLCS